MVTQHTELVPQEPREKIAYTCTDGAQFLSGYDGASRAKREAEAHQRRIDAQEILKGVRHGYEDWWLVKSQEEADAVWRELTHGEIITGITPHTYPALLRVNNPHSHQGTVLHQDDIRQMFCLFEGKEYDELWPE